MAKVRINDLAREIGTKSRHILKALPKLGENDRKGHSSSLSEAVADRVRKHFENKPNHQGASTATPANSRPRVNSETPQSVCPHCSADIAVKEFAGHKRECFRKKLAFPKKLAKCSHCEMSFLKGKLAAHISNSHPRTLFTSSHIVIQIPAPKLPVAHATEELISCQQCGAKVFHHAMELHIANIHSKKGANRLPRLTSTKFPFVVLPPGHWDFLNVFNHYRRNSISHSHRFMEQAPDWDRLEQLAKLRPVLRHFGLKAWFGYAVYEFSYSRRVVLECPIEGNATYVISGDWKKMIHRTKAELRSDYADQCNRVFHVGDWLERISEALRMQ